MPESVRYKLRSGKPNKLLHFAIGLLRAAMPGQLYRFRFPQAMAEARRRPDYAYMLERADYYNRLAAPFTVGPGDRCERHKSWLNYTGPLSGFRRGTFHTAYYLDQREVGRWFGPMLRWNFCPGDVYFTPDVPTVVKSRLLAGDNRNSVLLKLDRLRHFLFVDDHTPFAEKDDRVVFRGKIRQSRLRTAFMSRFHGSSFVDCGVVGRNEGCPEEWMTEKMTIRDHLRYKFIMAIEGNDVASNLKWVMSSNSIAVMPRPTCETWFMEGTLKPDYHYIEVREDFSDLEEKLRYYIAHPAEAEAIVAHAHEYVAQFRDERRELLISLLVMQKYFTLSGQLS